MANMPLPRMVLAYQRTLLLVLCFFVTAFVLLYGWHAQFDGLSSLSTYIESSRRPYLLSSADNLYDVHNTTLGFQEIRVISLPERSDKHDAWAVTASIFGLEYGIADGVDAESISPKALPYTMDRRPKVVACWRAHLNVLQDMVKRSVASTLIFEDDADWDVALRSQLLQFARGSRWLLNFTLPQHLPLTAQFDSPYGPAWDLLWLGHCGVKPDPWDHRRFVIPDDPTAQPAAVREGVRKPDMHYWEDASMQTRAVMSQHYGVCTNSYAISLAGAKKALYHMSMLPYDEPIDWGLSTLCHTKKSDFTCLAPYPPLIGLFRPTGNTSTHSDIENYDGETEYQYSINLVYSLRMNLDRLLEGERMMRAEEKTASLTGLEEMDIESIGTAVGYEEILDELGPGDAVDE